MVGFCPPPPSVSQHRKQNPKSLLGLCFGSHYLPGLVTCHFPTASLFGHCSGLLAFGETLRACLSSKPLHILFPLSGMLFLQIPSGLVPRFFQLSDQMSPDQRGPPSPPTLLHHHSFWFETISNIMASCRRNTKSFPP